MTNRTVSIIIPALNEAAYLPGLLDALRGQTCPVAEIIVADAGSIDGTADIARLRGAYVVRGGMPAVGRNAGAQAATGDVFLFLDADVLPPEDFIEHALVEFTHAGYDVATCLIEPLGNNLADRIIIEAVNLYLQVLQPISPRAPGFCILADRAIHQSIGGFDESLRLSEDHDYVQRASQRGEFGILTGVHIPVSMRRLEKEGLIQLGLKYLWCEMSALAGKPVHSTPFEYSFGAYQTDAPAMGTQLIDIAELRAQLGRYANPLQHLSRTSLDQLRHLVELEPVDVTIERIRLLFEHHDLDTLNRYLQQRLTLIRPNSQSLQETWMKFKSLPQESIRLLEPHRARSNHTDEPPERTS
jgi:hypothetical protein